MKRPTRFSMRRVDRGLAATEESTARAESSGFARNRRRASDGPRTAGEIADHAPAKRHDQGPRPLLVQPRLVAVPDVPSFWSLAGRSQSEPGQTGGLISRQRLVIMRATVSSVTTATRSARSCELGASSAPARASGPFPGGCLNARQARQCGHSRGPTHGWALVRVAFRSSSAATMPLYRRYLCRPVVRSDGYVGRA